MQSFRKTPQLNSSVAPLDPPSQVSTGYRMELKYQRTGGGQFFLMEACTFYGLCRASVKGLIMVFISVWLQICLAQSRAKMRHSLLEVSGSSMLIHNFIQ